MTLKYPEGLEPGDTIIDLFDRTARLGQPSDFAVFIRNSTDEDINEAIGKLTRYAMAERGEFTMDELNETLRTMNPIMEFMIRIGWEEPEKYVCEIRLTEVQAVQLVTAVMEMLTSNNSLKAVLSYSHSLSHLLYPKDSGIVHRN